MSASHAVRLAREGADVIAIDIAGPVTEFDRYSGATPEELAETARLVGAKGRRVLARAVDVHDGEAMAGVVADGSQVGGRLDVVVANAGLVNWSRFWEMSEDQWRSMIGRRTGGVHHPFCASVGRQNLDDPGASDLSRAVTATQREPPRCDPAGPGQEAVARERRRNRRRSRIASRQARAALSSAAPTNATKRSSALM